MSYISKRGTSPPKLDPFKMAQTVLDYMQQKNNVEISLEDSIITLAAIQRAGFVIIPIDTAKELVGALYGDLDVIAMLKHRQASWDNPITVLRAATHHVDKVHNKPIPPTPNEEAIREAMTPRL